MLNRPPQDGITDRRGANGGSWALVWLLWFMGQLSGGEIDTCGDAILSVSHTSTSRENYHNSVMIIRPSPLREVAVPIGVLLRCRRLQNIGQ